MIALSQHAEGVVLPVRAQPRARKSAVTGLQAGALKVSVTAPPEDGKANAALVKVLAAALDLRRSHIELLSGATARDKKFLLRGVSVEVLAQRIDELLSAQ